LGRHVPRTSHSRRLRIATKSARCGPDARHPPEAPLAARRLRIGSPDQLAGSCPSRNAAASAELAGYRTRSTRRGGRPLSRVALARDCGRRDPAYERAGRRPRQTSADRARGEASQRRTLAKGNCPVRRMKRSPMATSSVCGWGNGPVVFHASLKTSQPRHCQRRSPPL